MTTFTDIANRALQVPGTRTNVTDAELAANSTNEAIQINLKIDNVRRRLMRMAPWNFALKTVNLIYITSSPGTPENPTAATTLWQPGQPPPPWNYEYQYPVDCLRACWVIPSTQTGFAGGIPISTAVTGGASSFWQGPPVKYKIQTDAFRPVTAAAVVSGGTGYQIGDRITLQGGLDPTTGLFFVSPTGAPMGAPAVLQVLTLSGSAVDTVEIVPQWPKSFWPAFPGVAQDVALGGSYFQPQTNPQAQAWTTGLGSGATFNLTYGIALRQRVLLTNQEFAILCYVQDITNPDIMDDQFLDAWGKVLGAEITIPLSGDKKLANMAIQEANNIIQWARVGDGNEGFQVNDVTPDWIRVRGIDFVEPYSGPFTGFDWGGMYPIFG